MLVGSAVALGCGAAGAPSRGAGGRAAAGAPGEARAAAGASPSAAGALSAAPAPGSGPVAAPAPPRARPPRGGPALAVGTWRLVDHTAQSEITLELRPDGSWALGGASYRSSGTYRWLDAAELETTVIASNLDSEVGAVLRRRITVDATELVLGAPQRAGAKRQADEAGGSRRFRRVGGR